MESGPNTDGSSPSVATSAPSPAARGTSGDDEISATASAAEVVRRAERLIATDEHDRAEIFLSKALAALGNDLRVRETWEELQLARARRRTSQARQRHEEAPDDASRRIWLALTEEQRRLEIRLLQARCQRYPGRLGLRAELIERLRESGSYAETLRNIQELRDMMAAEEARSVRRAVAVAASPADSPDDPADALGGDPPTDRASSSPRETSIFLRGGPGETPLLRDDDGVSAGPTAGSAAGLVADGRGSAASAENTEEKSPSPLSMGLRLTLIEAECWQRLKVPAKALLACRRGLAQAVPPEVGAPASADADAFCRLLLTIGQMESDLGETEAARKSWSRLAALRPDFGDVRSRLDKLPAIRNTP